MSTLGRISNSGGIDTQISVRETQIRIPMESLKKRKKKKPSLSCPQNTLKKRFHNIRLVRVETFA